MLLPLRHVAMIVMIDDDNRCYIIMMIVRVMLTVLNLSPISITFAAGSGLFDIQESTRRSRVQKGGLIGEKSSSGV